MTVRRRRRGNKILIFLVILLSIVVIVETTMLAVFVWFRQDDNTSQDVVNEEEPSNDIEETPEVTPAFTEVDFQPVIDNWVKTVGGNKSVYIYDLNLDKAVGSYNIKEDYKTASLYKLFVVYEGYKRVNSGEWNGENKAGSTGYTISRCLDLAIRESYSPCAETLWGMIGRDKLDTIIETEWGITKSDISKLISNVSDISTMMKRFYEHPEFNDSKLIENMWDSFLNQPKTSYDWRQGLPSGFTKASVYNKVGWEYNSDKKYWNIYHDTAIVKFPLEDGTTRDYIVTVMTNKVDFKYIKNLGKLLEEHFTKSIV